MFLDVAMNGDILKQENPQNILTTNTQYLYAGYSGLGVFPAPNC
jgi:hypothetical protein